MSGDANWTFCDPSVAQIRSHATRKAADVTEQDFETAAEHENDNSELDKNRPSVVNWTSSVKLYSNCLATSNHAGGTKIMTNSTTVANSYVPKRRPIPSGSNDNRSRIYYIDQNGNTTEHTDQHYNSSLRFGDDRSVVATAEGICAIGSLVGFVTSDEPGVAYYIDEASQVYSSLPLHFDQVLSHKAPKHVQVYVGRGGDPTRTYYQSIRAQRIYGWLPVGSVVLPPEEANHADGDKDRLCAPTSDDGKAHTQTQPVLHPDTDSDTRDLRPTYRLSASAYLETIKDEPDLDPLGMNPSPARLMDIIKAAGRRRRRVAIGYDRGPGTILHEARASLANVATMGLPGALRYDAGAAAGIVHGQSSAAGLADVKPPKNVLDITMDDCNDSRS